MIFSSSLVFLTGCFGTVKTDVCVYNAKGYYFRCGKVELSKKRYKYISKRKNVAERKMNAAVCIPAYDWPKVNKKITEAREYCLDRKCF